MTELKTISFATEGDVTMFSNKFENICANYLNAIGAPISNGMQRAAFLDGIRPHDIHSSDGGRLVARTPEALAPLRQSFMF